MFVNLSADGEEITLSVRARPGRSPALSISHNNGVLYGASVWAGGTCNGPTTAGSGPGSGSRSRRALRPSPRRLRRPRWRRAPPPTPAPPQASTRG
jgi:hypothetical protein